MTIQFRSAESLVRFGRRCSTSTPRTAPPSWATRTTASTCSPNASTGTPPNPTGSR
jgi:hypothetical protein